MSSNNVLPETMKALIVHSTSEPPTIETVPTPKPTIASAVVRVLVANAISYIREIYNGERKYPFPTPLIPGTSAIGRVAAVSPSTRKGAGSQLGSPSDPATAFRSSPSCYHRRSSASDVYEIGTDPFQVGPDATKLKPGDLVIVDCTVRSRDEPADVFLAAISYSHTPGSQKLMRDVYRDWTYAEYCLCPLETLTLMDEQRLTGAPDAGGLGYKLEDLAYVASMMVPYGGLRDIELKAGQTVIVAPATGPFGGAAVLVALAMGARVIAMGRNTTSLDKLKQRVPCPERVETVPITGDMAAEMAELQKYGQIDAYFDIGPAAAYNSTHIKACILSLKQNGRVSLMGGYREDVAIPHVTIMRKNLRLYGKWMFERSDIADMLKLIEHGVLKVGKSGGSEVLGVYPLEEWKEAWDRAAETGPGQIVVIKP